MTMVVSKDITPEQIKKLWATARELNLDNELVHDLVWALTGKDSIKILSKAEAILVIDEMQKRLNSKHVSAPNRASIGQINKIRALEYELGWAEEPARLRGFIKKFGKVENIHWLTPKAASDVIEGLKNILARQTTGSNKHQL